MSDYTSIAMTGPTKGQYSAISPSAKSVATTSGEVAGSMSPNLLQHPTALDQFQEYDFFTVRKLLTWSYELPDSPLRDEYIAFYVDKTSMGWLLFSSIAMAISILSVSLFILVDTSRLLHDIHTIAPSSTTAQLLYGKVVFDIVRVFLSFTATVAGFYLCYLQRESLHHFMRGLWSKFIKSTKPLSTGNHSQTIDGNTASNSTTTIASATYSASNKSFLSNAEPSPAAQPSDPPSPRSVSKDSGEEAVATPSIFATSKSFVRTVRHYYIFAYLMVFLIHIIQRTIFTPECTIFDRDTMGMHMVYSDHDLEQSTSITFQGGVHCASYGAKSAAFQGNMFGMAFIALVFFANFPDINLKLIWFFLLIMSMVCTFCAAWIHAYDAIPTAILICIAVGLVLIDKSVRNIVIFLTTKKLKKLIVETEKSAEQAHAVEMRHMIANVAHDLKTVSITLSLSSFSINFSSAFIASFFFYYWC